MKLVGQHLELEELLAKVNGRALDGEVGKHLASCQACRLEAERWAAVAGGLHYLMGQAPSLPPLEREAFASPKTSRGLHLRRAGIRLLGGTNRPRAIVAAAASVAVVAGGAYGLARSLEGSRSAPQRGGKASLTAGVTAVKGCSGLDGTAGTLEAVNGTSLVLKTSNGASVTVSTTSGTKVSREVTGSISDITNGARVFVKGTDSDGTITAQTVGVNIGPAVSMPSVKPAGLPRPGSNGAGQFGLGLGVAAGTAADVSSGSFTVVESDGSRVPVVAPSSTTVITLVDASLSTLQTGELTVAVGSAGDGTLSATTVEQEDVSPSSLPHPSLPGGAGLPLPRPGLSGGAISALPNLGCSPSAVATAALVAES